jgi:hypothetical protein
MLKKAINRIAVRAEVKDSLVLRVLHPVRGDDLTVHEGWLLEPWVVAALGLSSHGTIRVSSTTPRPALHLSTQLCCVTRNMTPASRVLLQAHNALLAVRKLVCTVVAPPLRIRK